MIAPATLVTLCKLAKVSSLSVTTSWTSTNGVFLHAHIFLVADDAVIFVEKVGLLVTAESNVVIVENIVFFSPGILHWFETITLMTLCRMQHGRTSTIGHRFLECVPVQNQPAVKQRVTAIG